MTCDRCKNSSGSMIRVDAPDEPDATRGVRATSRQISKSSQFEVHYNVPLENVTSRAQHATVFRARRAERQGDLTRSEWRPSAAINRPTTPSREYDEFRYLKATVAMLSQNRDLVPQLLESMSPDLSSDMITEAGRFLSNFASSIDAHGGVLEGESVGYGTSSASKGLCLETKIPMYGGKNEGIKWAVGCVSHPIFMCVGIHDCYYDLDRKCCRCLDPEDVKLKLKGLAAVLLLLFVLVFRSTTIRRMPIVSNAQVLVLIGAFNQGGISSLRAEWKSMFGFPMPRWIEDWLFGPPGGCATNSGP